jgi:hypothetical protein
MSAEIHTLNTGERLESESNRKYDYEAVAESVFSRFQVQLLHKVSLMLNNADSSLSALAENSETSDEEAVYSELAQLLRIERSNIDKAFFIALNDKAKTGDASETDELSLVDPSEMEELIAISTMYSNAMNNYGQEVSNLQARLEYLGMSLEGLHFHVFDPRNICEAFQTALKRLNIKLEYKLLLLKLFDMEVSTRLGDMYKSLNQIFIDADIMPEIVYQAKSPDNETTKKADEDKQTDKGFTVREATYYDPQKNKASNFIPRTREEISYFISQFMNGFTTAEGEDIPDSFSTLPSDKDNHNCYSRKELMNALSKLQRNLSKKKHYIPRIDADQIKRAIMADMGSSNGGAVTKKVHLLDQRNIDFVGMMFKAITNDQSISRAITNLLMSLQVPVIKVAMLDESLFQNDDHPARETLDLISEAGKGITDVEDETYQQLDKIVDDILQEYQVDIDSFECAVDALHTLIDTEKEVAAENERQERRKVIREHAREVVLTEMRHLTANKKLPKHVQPLVLKHYPSMMCNRYIKHGRESSEWLLSLMLLKLLMKCLQPIKSKAQWQLVKNHHIPLVEAVNDELYETQQDKAEIDAQIAALKKTFLKMLDDYGYKLVKDDEKVEDTTNAAPYVEKEDIAAANETFNQDEHDAQAAKIKEQTRLAREKMSRLPTDLYPGAWFEIFNGDDKPVRRLKLSVLLTEVAKLIFVDCHGVKVIEKDAADFAEELQQHQSRLIADHSTFEHALGTVIHKLAA